MNDPTLDLHGLDLSGRRFVEGSLNQSDLRDCKFCHCNFFRFSLRGVKVGGAEVENSVFEDCSIALREGRVSVRESEFHGCELWNADNASLEDCLIKGCTSEEVPWENLDLARCAVNNCWFPLCEIRKSHLEGVKFNGCILHDFIISDSVLTDCSFEGCDAARMVLVRCTLEGCKLPEGAEIRDCA